MNLLLFFIIASAFFLFDFKRVFFLAFAGGLLSDLILGSLVGFSSLCFLLICFLVYLYRRKFSSSHLLFQLSFVLLADWLIILINGEPWFFKNSLILFFLGLIVFSFVNKIREKTSTLEIP